MSRTGVSPSDHALAPIGSMPRVVATPHQEMYRSASGDERTSLPSFSLEDMLARLVQQNEELKRMILVQMDVKTYVAACCSPDARDLLILNSLIVLTLYLKQWLCAEHWSERRRSS